MSTINPGFRIEWNPSISPKEPSVSAGQKTGILFCVSFQPLEFAYFHLKYILQKINALYDTLNNFRIISNNLPWKPSISMNWDHLFPSQVVQSSLMASKLFSARKFSQMIQL